MFVAKNSIFEVDYKIFFSQINSAEGVLPNVEVWKHLLYHLQNICKSVNLMVKTL